MTVDLGTYTRRMLWVAVSVCALITFAASAAMIITDAGRGFYLGVAIFFLIFCAFFVWGISRFLDSGKLTIDATNISFVGDGQWSIGWHELDSVYTDTVVETVPDAGSLQVVGIAVPCVELIPCECAARTAHPEMEHLWQLDRWRLPVRTPGSALNKIARGIRRYRPRG